MAGLVGVLLLVGISVGGYRLYNRWQGQRLVHRAQNYLDWGDARSAALTARRAFQLNSSNADAARVLARIGEHDGQSSAIDWRQQVLTIAPNSMEDQIALARTALQFNRIGLADSALAKVRGTAQQLPTFHEAEGQLALAKKDPAGAEKHFAEANRLDPANKLYQLNLAVLQLQSSSPETREGARALLQQLLEDKALRVPAGRALRDYAAQQNDIPGVLSVAQLLHDYPEATFQDRLSYAQVLHVLDRPEFAGILTALQNEAAPDSEKLTRLLTWMVSSRLSVLGLHWIKELPAEMLNKRPVPAAVADCYVAANDWDGLYQWCKTTNWGDLEFLRHAYFSRAARERGDDFGAKSEWNAALQGAGGDGERLNALEQDVANWGWKKETEDLLWLLAKDPDKQSAALALLYQHYSDKGDTGNLYRVVSRLLEIRADDEKAQNNFVQLSLLLNVNVEHARGLAEQLYRKDPKNPIFASTYGFSLFRAGHNPQALKVMDDLKPEDLQNPAIAAYYGIFLAAAGDKDKAAEYLERGAGAPLLPEEKLLVENARSQIQGKGP